GPVALPKPAPVPQIVATLKYFEHSQSPSLKADCALKSRQGYAIMKHVDTRAESHFVPYASRITKDHRMLRHTLTVGHIAAIPIRVHWSWLAVLLLVVGILSQVYASAASDGLAWLLASAAGLLLWVSVVLHELGHALVAQRYNFTVRSI